MTPSPPVAPIHWLDFNPSSLPPRPTKSIQTFLGERESDPWFWRALATLSAFLVAIGFLIFPGAFPVESEDQSDSRTISITIGALVATNMGYILSVAVWFLRKNWVFQLDCIFLPCLYSSLLGLVNSLVVPSLVLKTRFTAPTLAAVAVSIISTIVYGFLSLFTWRRLERLRKAPKQGLPALQDPAWKSDEELQRGQWTNLYKTQGENITAAQLSSYRTYNIEPIIPQRSRDTSPYADRQTHGYGGDYHTT